MNSVRLGKNLTLSLLILFAGGISPSIAAIFLGNGQALEISPEEIEKRVVSEPSRKAAGAYGSLDESDSEPDYILIDDMCFSVREDEIGVQSAFTGRKWTDGHVYYVFDENVTETNKQRFRDAAAEWSSIADLTFVEGTGMGDYIHVQSDDGNSSYVGRIGGKQILRMYNWNYKYIIAHEIGHALGLVHEQSRSDRDIYVTIFSGNIVEGMEYNFSKESTIDFGEYDFDSIMHYSKRAFSSNGENTIEPKPSYSQYLNSMGQRNYLSSLDEEGMISRYGIRPALVVSPSPVDFGVWSVGGTIEKNLTFQKVGSGMTSGTVTISAPYTILSGATYSLYEGQSQVLTIRYAPVSEGHHDQILTFSSGESESVTGRAISTSDSDGDGHSDWEEYIAGTNPANPADFFFLYSPIVNVDGSIVFEFPTKNGRSYQLQSIDRLAYGTWVDIGTPIDGNGIIRNLNATTSGRVRGFYQVVVTMLP